MNHQDGIESLIAQVVERECALFDDLSLRADRRKEPRWPVADQCAKLSYRGMEYRVKIEDISLSGMRIANVPDVLTVGDTVQIVTLLGMTATLAMAWEVIHLVETDGVRHAGLQFTPQNPAFRDRTDTAANR